MFLIPFQAVLRIYFFISLSTSRFSCNFYIIIIYRNPHQNKGTKNRRIIIAHDTPILIQLSIKVDIRCYSGISPLIFP